MLKDNILSDCRPEWAFWMCNGRVIRNIYELADSIEVLKESHFLYHVNDDNKKNDFANWISDVLGDDELARQLKSIRNKKTYVAIIRERIIKLEFIP